MSPKWFKTKKASHNTGKVAMIFRFSVSIGSDFRVFVYTVRWLLGFDKGHNACLIIVFK